MDSKAQSQALVGVDFTSSPSRRKPIALAFGRAAGGVVQLDSLQSHTTLDAFAQWLALPGAWLGAFDFPFGLPRGFVEAQRLGSNAEQVIRRLRTRCPDRMAFRRLVDTWGNDQPEGYRLLHRQTDAAMPGVSSTSPLQTRYVPVGWMYFEGFWRLDAAGVDVPGLCPRSDSRVALEAYPGLLAHELIQRRSYKNRDEPDRLIARKEIVDALEQGRTRLALRLKLSHAKRELLVDDPSGDRLDAVLCLMQAAWASTRPGYGLPSVMDGIEGWIATVARP